MESVSSALISATRGRDEDGRANCDGPRMSELQRVEAPVGTQQRCSELLPTASYRRARSTTTARVDLLETLANARMPYAYHDRNL